MNSSVALVVGTRPEIVKLAMVARELGRAGVLIHTGQHYDPEMSAQFFEEFGIGEPGVVIEGVGARSRAGQIATAMHALADEFASGRYGAVIVQGDTNTVSAAAQAANYAGVPLIHVEAGLRSHDRAMPEEINRLVAGALADVHCAATSVNAANLRAEGVEPERILLTGNTIVEATLHSLQQGAPTLPAEAGLLSSGVVATIHRPENTDTRESLTRVLMGLAGIDAPVVLVAHPRTRSAIERFNLGDLASRVHLIEPVSHRQLLAMMSRARLVVSDSGGLQEECTVVKTPLIVVRRSTERPESIDAGFSRLVTPDQDIAGAANAVLAGGTVDLTALPSPYGDGQASMRIARIALALADGARVPDLPAIAGVASAAA